MTKIIQGNIERDMTEYEEALHQQDIIDDAARAIALAEKAALKQAVLDKLGLTPDEVAALFS
jgi:hypothetical protein